jgi:hypothetical protein
MRRAAAVQAFSAEAVRFYLRLRERAEQAPALRPCPRWGLAGVALSVGDLRRYETLAVIAGG